jgi:chromosome partitioning protein
MSIEPRNRAPQSQVRCDECGRSFAVEYAYQTFGIGSKKVTVCSTECRKKRLASLKGVPTPSGDDQRTRAIAVMNQKGGTGKTTTSVNMAAGLAELGNRVLLVDADPQGHVGVSLGVRGKKGLYDILVDGTSPKDVAIPVRADLDVLSSSDRLAAAEVNLARKGFDRQRIFTTRMRDVSDYDYVVIDCGPSLSLLNMNMLVYADELLVPVACDFLSLVGVRHLLKTVERLNRTFSSPVEVLGFLPTFFDRRNRISEESIDRLEARFGDLVLPPIRINARLKEAPSHQRTIFEYAPDSRGAEDYRRLCDWIADDEE